MAKKNVSYNKIAAVCAFVALVISGVGYLLARLVGGSLGTLSLVANVCLVLATIITAYGFVKTLKGKFWLIVYWVFAILALVTLFL